MTLFDEPGPGLTEAFEAIRDDPSESGAEHRALFDSQWAAAAPYLDANFKSAFARETHQRFWELRLVTAMLALRFPLEPAAEGRPDIATVLPDGRRLWIEAIAPTLGAANNPDRPPRLQREGLNAVPVDKLLLRLSQGVWDKTRKMRRYREQGVIVPGDCTVIAVSSGAFWPYIDPPDEPRILAVLFPIGNQCWVIDRETHKVVRVDHDYRGEVAKANGEAIAMTAFDAPSHADISGVIYDFARCKGVSQQDFGRFFSVNNPHAEHPLPDDYLRLGRAYRVVTEGEKRQLIWTDHPQA